MRDSATFSLVYRVVNRWNGGVTIPGGVNGKTVPCTQCHCMIYKVAVSQRLVLIISEVFYNLNDPVIL